MYLWRETWLHPVFRFLCWKCKQIIAHLIQYFVLQMQNVDCTVINQPKGLVTFALYEDLACSHVVPTQNVVWFVLLEILFIDQSTRCSQKPGVCHCLVHDFSCFFCPSLLFSACSFSSHEIVHTHLFCHGKMSVCYSSISLSLSLLSLDLLSSPHDCMRRPSLMTSWPQGESQRDRA